MNERINLCYIVNPRLEELEAGKKLAEDTRRDFEVIAGHRADVTRQGYALEYGTKKQLEEIAAIEAAEKAAAEKATAAYDVIKGTIISELDRQEYVTLDMINHPSTARLCEAFNSGLIVHPAELAQVWKLCSDNSACRRLVGRYAASRGWENVFVGDRLEAVKTVINAYLDCLKDAIDNPLDSYGAVWLKNPDALKRLAAENGVYEEFGIDIEALSNSPDEYRDAAEDAFVHTVLKRRAEEYTV